MASEIQDLETLARLYGVQTSYHDAMGRFVQARPEALLAALDALGAEVEGPGDVRGALEARHQELAERLIEPVLVAWDGHAPRIELGGSHGHGVVACHLDLEGGERRGWSVGLENGSFSLPETLPPGYHRLRIETGGRSTEALVISAPTRAYNGDGRPLWGVFLPLYALHTSRSWGAGDFTDLEALAEWTASLGGGVVATLPMLATFLDEPCEPSPYAPASRLFWNELYLDPWRLPEADESQSARRLLESSEVIHEIQALRALPLVDYPRLMMLKRRVLEEMAARFFAHPSSRQEAFERFVRERPELPTYAAFRAVGDRRGDSWQNWPERLREGHLAPADYDEEDRRYHLWVQWSCDQQMQAMAREARRRGPGLYLDLPLGVHGSSYDVWREGGLFAAGASAGAPPDAFFTKGQNWGFPPLRPERLRDSGYAHLIACLRHHLRYAGLLRIDHVMQLHRLFWIPNGMGAADGVYVNYPAEELYAILSLESHRHQAMIVGENLGTVPPEVWVGMERHDILGMYVVQYELQPGSQGVREPPAQSAASLNTHDMPTFRGFLDGKDVDDLENLGFFDARQAHEERQRRAAIRWEMAAQAGGRGDDESVYPQVLRNRLRHLAASPARMVLVNLEDLWQEDRPQNVPGTHDERPNWRRKARLSFDEFANRPDVVEPLREVDELRRRRG
ncbi:MAG TPA: 4-alpha-glucanotransferase [Thermoanaerobaculia bacterium]|nr:4-alpha-glucanotransferase [Thermoanaerobaculia bacterium]